MDGSVTELRADLAAWIARARGGEDVVVTDRGAPVARLTAVEQVSLLARLTREGLLSRPAPGSRPRAGGVHVSGPAATSPASSASSVAEQPCPSSTSTAALLVKLVVEEDGSDLAAALWDGADAVVSSRLAGVEVRAALAAAHRGRRLDDVGWTAADDRWADLSMGLSNVEPSPAVAARAGDLAVEQGLRGADAVHLASALAVMAEDLVVAVRDDGLAAGALSVRVS